MNTTQIRSVVALVVAIVATAGIVWYLQSISPALTTGTTMRSTLAWTSGPASQYEAYDGLWLAVRAILALYITGVAGVVTLQALVAVREHTTVCLATES